MRFAFTEEQTMLRDMLAAALQREAPLPRLRAWCDAGDFSEFEGATRANGWAGIGADDAVGGQGGGLIEQALLFEALGQQAAPSGGLLGQVAAQVLAARAGVPDGEMADLIGAAPAQAFDARRAIDACDGEPVGAAGDTLSGCITYALLAGAGAGAGTGTSTSTGQGGGWLVLVPDADADGDDHTPGYGPGHYRHGAALWRVAPGASGLTVTPRPMVDRTRAFATLTLQGVPARRIGRLGAAELTEAHARIALLVAAESLGLARRMLAMTTAYVAQRVQFGVPIGSFQAVKHEAAQMLVDIEAAHSGIYYAAWALDEGITGGEGDALMHAWIAKAFTCEAAARTADRALMLHGAMGYTLEYDLHFFFKRAKLNLELLGSPRSHRDRIAAALPLLPPTKAG